jgi:hypothetical protein
MFWFEQNKAYKPWGEANMSGIGFDDRQAVLFFHIAAFWRKQAVCSICTNIVTYLQTANYFLLLLFKGINEAEY